ncbi:hypothetical protein DCAR_0206424 [Daucus carota subsp. sativus]|uniref:S-acyltransferase n=2 Tax=Daucus carota subsp. sativus TaxID=79200 RepID=A0AAF0WD51_DAUCS|nr:hypothetical protein DCAR_0206424 [Daucus carota subsp. sativus]
MRSHGWQRPLHPLQIVGMSIFSFLVVAFYCFLGLFLGNRSAEISVTTIYSFVVLAVMFLFVRCTAINPTDKTSSRKLKKRANLVLKLNYGFVFSQLIVRFFRRMERKILRNFIRRKYLDPWKTSAQMEPLLPFPLVMKDDAIAPDPKEDDISFCALCDMEVKKHSKHCRTCNRCVEGFDHHCRWLNNCVGKRNYTTFILLMVFVLLMLLIEGGTALAIFIRCFTDKRGVEHELERRLYMKFPRGLLAAISMLLVLLTAYSSAALGQLFFFHVVLIRKGMKTYDYILAMKEANQSMELESIDDSDFSSDDESIDSDLSEKPSFISKFICRDQVNQKPQRLSIRIDKEPEQPILNKKQGFHASINPWKLITMNREKALLAAAKARDKLAEEKATSEQDSLKPLPLETKRGPSINIEKDMASEVSGSTTIISQANHSTSPSLFSSPRRRFSSSPSRTAAAVAASPKHRYKSSFDLKLTEVSQELETYISRQVLCSVLKETGCEASPR